MSGLIPPSRRRMLVMPVVILAVGCGVAWWSSARQARDREEIVQVVMRVIGDVCGGGSDSVPTEPGSLVLREMLVEELRKMCAMAGGAGSLEVHVNAGDEAGIGAGAGGATHTAVIRMKDSGQVLLALRVHRAESGGVTIVGYSVEPGE